MNSGNIINPTSEEKISINIGFGASLEILGTINEPVGISTGTTETWVGIIISDNSTLSANYLTMLYVEKAFEISDSNCQLSLNNSVIMNSENSQ